jgi:hypothetical protein
VGSENGKVFDSKSSSCKAKPPEWHARFFVTLAKQTEQRRPSANFVLSTAAPLCIAGMQKKKKKKKKKKREEKTKMKLTFRLI